jgi:hypothetical protein
LPNAAKAWAKLSRGAKAGSILGALGILPFGTYVAIGMAYTSGRSISARTGSFLGFLAGGLASLAVFVAVLLVAAGFGGMLGDFIGRLVAPPSGQN